MIFSKAAKTETDTGAYISVDALLSLRYLAKGVTLNRNKSSQAIMEGESRTRFRGRGMEFSEVRPYNPGDDVRNIDWRVTARTQQPYTKLFQEERERPVFIAVDQRSSMFFGSTRVFKSVYAAQLAAIIAWAALEQNDRIGAVVFGDDDKKDLRAKRGKHAVLNFLHELHTFNAKLNSPIAPQREYSLEKTLQDLRRMAKPGSAIYLISDFADFNEACEEPMAMISRHTDLTLLKVYDYLEETLPEAMNLTLSDSHARLNLAYQGEGFYNNYRSRFQQHLDSLQGLCRRLQISLANIRLDQPVEEMVTDIFSASKFTRTRRARR